MRNSGRIPDTLREGTVQASSPAEVTVLLARARAGDAQALGAAYAAVYEELKRAARAQLRRMRDNFQTTALVHEAYLKLGGGQDALTLTASLGGVEKVAVDVLALDELLASLHTLDERAAQIVELRYFGGYEETEIAQMLGLSDRTVRRDWRKARAFLLAELQP